MSIVRVEDWTRQELPKAELSNLSQRTYELYLHGGKMKTRKAMTAYAVSNMYVSMYNHHNTCRGLAALTRKL